MFLLALIHVQKTFSQLKFHPLPGLSDHHQHTYIQTMASINLRQTASGIPSIVPRLIGSLQNIPPISIRLPFGLQPKQKTGEQEQNVDRATPNESFVPPKAGIASLPAPFFTDNNGLVMAVPKKKVSHQKKRQRQLAGDKRLKELRNLDRCPSCGHVKRMHTLCMNCVKDIKQVFKEREQAEAGTPESYSQDLSKDDERIIYPGKRDNVSLREKREREDFIYRRPRSLPYEKGN